MESLNQDILATVFKTLDKEALKSLYTVDKSVSTNFNTISKDYLFWKSKAEELVGIELPFTATGDDPLKYWRDLALELEANLRKLTRLYATGKYEYVYIAITKGIETATDTEAALYEAVHDRESNTVKFILNNSKDLTLVDMRKYLTMAIIDSSDEIAREILEHTTRKDVEYNLDDAYNQPIVASLTFGKVNIFKAMLDKYPIKTYKEWDKILGSVANTRAYYREEFLAILLPMYIPDQRHPVITDYILGTKDKTVSGNEMRMLLESDVFDVDEVLAPKKLSAEAAYMLYVLDSNSYTRTISEEYELNDNGSPREYKSKLLEIVLQDSVLLAKALQYAKPLNGTFLLGKSLERPYEQTRGNASAGEDSGIVVLKNFTFEKEEVITAVRNCLSGGFYVKSVKYACIQFNITEEDLEVMIMEEVKMFNNGSVQDIIDLGVKLRRNPSSRYLIGEKLAFHCEKQGWRYLLDAGFDFDNCGTDLLKYIVVTKDNTWTTELLKYIVNKYDKDIYYFNYDLKPRSTRTGTLANLGLPPEKGNRLVSQNFSFTTVARSGNLDMILFMLDSGKVSWKNMADFTWISEATPSLAKHIQDGIKYLKNEFKNQILRGSSLELDKSLNKTFAYWLTVARGFEDKIKILNTYNSTNVHINGEVAVTIPYLIGYKGKYKGLDLFSDDGVPLTTREDIKSRRLELQKK